MSSYVREIASIDRELKRLRAHIKELTQQRAKAQEHLYAHMTRNRLEEVEGIRVEKVTPKVKVQRKSAKEKKQAALQLFMEVGINDPDTFWEDLQKIQKSQAPPPEEQPQEIEI